MSLSSVNYSGFSGGFAVPAVALTSGNISNSYPPFIGFATTAFAAVPAGAFIFNQITSTSRIYNYAAVGSNTALILGVTGVYAIKACMNLSNTPSVNSGSCYLNLNSYSASTTTTLGTYGYSGSAAVSPTSNSLSLILNQTLYLTAGTAISIQMGAGGGSSLAVTRYGYFMVYLISQGS